MGWHVLEARSASEAFDLMKAMKPLHVLFADIDLKESADGWDVADAFRVIHPYGAVVYTSGVERARSRACFLSSHTLLMTSFLLARRCAASKG